MRVAAAAGGLFYGWVVVAVFVVLALAFGASYSFGSFFDSLQREFGARRGDVSLAFAIAGSLYFGLGAVSGPIADRLGARWVVTFGMAALGIGLILASRATSILQVYLAYGLGVGVGVGFIYAPSVGAVQRWFVRRRGAASGFAVSGIGVGTLCGPPLAAAMVAWSDWRTAYLAMGLFTLACGLAAALLVHGTPQDRGLLPDGERPVGPSLVTAARQSPVGTPLAGATVRQALRSRPFWLIYTAFACCSIGLFMPVVHLIPYAIDRGYGQATGVLLVGMIGVGSTAGRFLLGGIADRLGRRRSFAAMFVGVALSTLWWLVAASRWELFGFALLFGMFYGGFVSLGPAVTADYFGFRNVSGLIGLLYSGVALGNLLGPTLAGYAYDIYGSYRVPIAVGAGTAALAAVAAFLLEDPERWQARSQAQALGSSIQ